MAQVMAALPFIGHGITALGQLQEGGQAQAEGLIEANQYEAAGRAEMANAGARAAEDRRQAALVASRAKAIAAASGGGVTDTTAQTQIGNIEGEGEYRALLDMYQGKQKSNYDQAEADAARRMGNQARKASRYRAAATVLDSLGSTSMFGGPS